VLRAVAHVRFLQFSASGQVLKCEVPSLFSGAHFLCTVRTHSTGELQLRQGLGCALSAGRSAHVGIA
jgi:hypothetical protein